MPNGMLLLHDNSNSHCYKYLKVMVNPLLVC